MHMGADLASSEINKPLENLNCFKNSLLNNSSFVINVCFKELKLIDPKRCFLNIFCFLNEVKYFRITFYLHTLLDTTKKQYIL